MTSKRSVRRAAVRFGRPPKALAGAVEERILGAALSSVDSKVRASRRSPRPRARESPRSTPAFPAKRRSSPPW